MPLSPSPGWGERGDERHTGKHTLKQRFLTIIFSALSPREKKKKKQTQPNILLLKIERKKEGSGRKH